MVTLGDGSKQRWTVRSFSVLLMFLQVLHSQSSNGGRVVAAQDVPSSVSSDAAASVSASSSHDPGAVLMEGLMIDEEGSLFASPPIDGYGVLSEEAATNLLFQPWMLNFADRSIGDPHNQLVVLYNRHKNRSVYLGSIAGSTAEFSSSYFKEKVIPPGGNTTFNVVYLPRKLGPAEGSLLIHTSFGMVRYQVQGEGIECPYRLRPLVGLQAPLNATLSPEITLYNPHDTPLQIVEIYSSGGNFQLELPSGAQEGPQALWEIPPHSTRTVIRVRFHARTPGNHIAYVRIKISGGVAEPSLIDKMLVVPIEVEIFKETGLYSRIPFLELGLTSAAAAGSAAAASAVAVAAGAGLTGSNRNSSTWLSLDLFNSGSQPVKVKSWGVQADDIESVLCMHVLVAEERTLHVEFDWSKLSSDRRLISGRILLNLERISTAPDGERLPEDDDQESDRFEGSKDGDPALKTATQMRGSGGSKIGVAYATEVPLDETEDDDDELEAELIDDGVDEVMSVLAIPFAGEVLKGSIQYNEEVLRFLVPTNEADTPGGAGTLADAQRPLVIRNQFHVPLSITNISVPENCSRYFTIDDFGPIVLQPNDERTLLRISRKSTVSGGGRWPEGTISTHIRLTTNITDYDLPVLAYSGKLKRILSPEVRDASLLTGLPASGGGVDVEDEEFELDFAVIPIATDSEALVAFVNPNPVPIPIIHWKGAITSDAAVGAPTITVILLGCGALRLDELAFCHTVQPGEWIVYQISVQSGTIDNYHGRFTVKTDYEEIVTPLRFTTAVGDLHLMRLRFADCFPGKLCSVPLMAASTFPSKIHIESIRTEVPGLSYEFLSPDKQRTLPASQPVVLYPEAMATIGRLLLDPKALCGTECYSSFDLLSKPFGVKWMATLDSYEQYRRLDSDKLLEQLQRYAEMRQRLTNVQFQVLAEAASRKFEFNASVELAWPKLLHENVFFPTLQVEQEAVKLITITNPSDQILFVHLVLHDVAVHGPAPAVDGGTPLPAEVLTACANCSLSEEPVFSFFLFDTDDIYVNYVKPQSFLPIAVKFTARQPGTYSTVLYMRNNLTLIDAAWIQARAVVPQFKFGNRRPGSPTALQFEMTDKHLRLCGNAYYDQLQQRSEGTGTHGGGPINSRKTDEAVPVPPPVVAEGGPLEAGVETRRTFTARNYGEVPIMISGIRIEEALCEGYGFKVLDCAPFELPPNASRKIEIAFAPDFTLARVVRMLHFDTNINNFPINFTLLGTVPMRGLEMCGLSLQRPWFEAVFRMLLMVAVTAAMAGTLVAAFLDSNRVLRNHFVSMTREKGPVQPPLDLRQIALQHSSAAAGAAATTPPVAEVKDSQGSGNHRSSSATMASRNNRKVDRKGSLPQTQPKGGDRAQNGTGPTHGPAESTANRFTRTWTEFTANLGRSSGAAKQPEGSRPQTANKSRRSITPPKDMTTKERSKPNAHSEEVGDGALGTEASATAAVTAGRTTIGGQTTAAVALAAPVPVPSESKQPTKSTSVVVTSDLTGALESNSNVAKQQQQHHQTSSSPRTSVKEECSSLEASSGSSSSVSSLSSSSSSSPSPTTKQQQQQQPHSRPFQPPTGGGAPKANVKKMKSLPVSYESVVVSLATVFVGTNTSTSGSPATSSSSSASTSQSSQKPTVTATTTPCSTSPASAAIALPKESSSSRSQTSDDGSSGGGGTKCRSGPAASGKQTQSGGSRGATSTGTGNTRSVELLVSGKASDKLAFLLTSDAGAYVEKENNNPGGNVILPAVGGTLSSGINGQIEAVQQQQQAAAKKFSKTPGRERKSNQGKKGANGGKQGAGQQYKGTALQFSSPTQQQHKSSTLGTILQNASIPLPAAAAAASTSSTVWGENCARFSDVVAQMPNAKPASIANGGFGMDVFAPVSGAASGQARLSQANLKALGNTFGTGGSNIMTTSAGGGAPRKHALQDSSNRYESVTSKDESYKSVGKGHSVPAPFVTTATANLGPIGTSKKSPTGSVTDSGTDADGIGFGAGLGNTGVTKCWEPFGGHVIHRPGQLPTAMGGDSSCIAGTGSQQSDSFFSQSFADLHHTQTDQSDHFRGVSSSVAGTATSTPSMVQPHNRGSLLAAHIGSGVLGNDFVGNRNASLSMHQQQQQQQDWNSTGASIEGVPMNWPLSSAHKSNQSSTTAGLLEWGASASDVWNNLAAQTQYQQPHQQQFDVASSMHYPPALVAAAAAHASANRLLQLQQAASLATDGLGHGACLTDAWYATQSAIAPPPGFSNLLSVGGPANAIGGMAHLQQQLQQQQQQQHPHQLLLPHQNHNSNNHHHHHSQQHQQQLLRQLSSDEATSTAVSGGSSGGPSSPTVPSTAVGGGAASSSSSCSSSGASSSSSSSASSIVTSTYDPYQLASIWASASNSDPWAAAAKKQ
ncbi:transmembrane protein 131 homolog [Anopheles bellator]|uniref:transmembrane protein 131 homolog n=1 Tax=Anopheles bellator TaxID=139047 RepID=UPI0026472656|nr:transmembrane protein 131 homolog [Anopheles bellator]